MRRLKVLTRFAQLGWPERRILIRVLWVVGVARASLWVLPIEKARRMVAKVAAGSTGDSVHQVVWAVRLVGRCLPGATCLTQALAAEALLTGAGFSPHVEIGVAKDELSGFQAHAWVVCHGQVVLGGQQVERYNSLIVWNRQE
jgi:Transglutaminase-like superfamily